MSVTNTLRHILVNGLKWLIIGLLGLFAIIAGILYVPGSLNRIAGWVLPSVEKSSGMKISVDDLRLKFPLKLTADGSTVIDASGDTMVVARRLDVAVNPLKLLVGNIGISSAELTDGMYRMGAPDSMYIRADIDKVSVHNASLNLGKGLIDVDFADLDGGRVNLIIGPDTMATAADTAASVPLLIKAHEIRLRHVDYSMSMLPVIDTLTAHVGSAVLSQGVVDMASRRISADGLTVDSVSAVYLTPPAGYPASHPESPAPAADSAAISPDEMWNITARHLSLTRSQGLYGVAGAEPQSGLDMNHIRVSDVNIEVDSFWNCGAQIRVPIRRLSGVERSGIEIDANGVFEMDYTAMHVKAFKINTLYSSVDMDAILGLDTLTSRAIMVDAAVAVGLQDVILAMPSLRPVLAAAPIQTPLTADVLVSGTMDNLNIEKLMVAMQRCFDASVSGNISNATDMDRISGKIDIRGGIINSGFLKPSITQARMGMPVSLPPLKLNGQVTMNKGAIDGRMTALTGGGRLALNAGWNGRPEAYRLKAAVDSFPVRSFLPELGVGAVTATADVKGHGLDFMSSRSALDATVNVKHIEYDGRIYSGISLDASLADGNAKAMLRSDNHVADLAVNVTGTLSDTLYTWNLDGDIRHMDLRALGFADTTMQGGVRLISSGSFAPSGRDIHLTLDAENLDWTIGTSRLKTDKITSAFNSADSLTTMTLDNRQLSMRFHSPVSLDTLIARFVQASDTVTRQISDYHIEIGAIQRVLPPMELSVTSGADNLINDYLAPSEISFRSFEMGFRNRQNLIGGMRVTGLRKGDSMRLDTIGIKLQQKGDSMIYAARIDNRPGTMDQFAHVLLDGIVDGNRLTSFVRQRNISGKTGYHLGIEATMDRDSVITVSFRPLDPVIAYKTWAINADNYVAFNMATKELKANLDMSGNGSRLQLTAVPGDSIGVPENVLLKVTDIKLSDWLAISPFAPPVTGSVSADMKIRYNSSSLWGDGTIGLADLTYGKERVGSFDLGVDISTTTKGVVNAEVALMIDSIKTITAVGALNDSTKTNPFDLDFSMIRLPLRVVNPFLPKGTARLSGMLNGNMQITGTLAAPVFNGYIDFDSTAVNVAMLGTNFKFSEEPVRVDSNLVKFDHFTISAINANPLIINGTVDMNTLSDPRVNLAMNAINMQVVGGKKRKGVDVYGKAFINLDAKVRGNMSFMSVDADLRLLRSTNVTYIMADAAPASLGLQDTDDMVRFVNFNDSASVAMADTIATDGMSLMVDASLSVEEGSTVNVDLSTDGNNKVQIQSAGSLNYSLSPFGESRVTGRLNINKGFVRYTPPFISEKLFKFQDGSYVAFNGDMMDPILNIHADQTLKANVTREGENSRLVNFIVGLSVTGTLQDMNVAFNMSTNDDITVQNELQAMSPEQRANQAMNMLLYNVYTGPGTKGNSNLSGNPLFSFLESQLNTWAANNIKGVDVSFGIDQYNQTRDGATSSTMSYSYQVSKTLFNDRFKIVVGGNYSTDANADENFSQNLINDISFEYMLNRSGSMYVKLFRHTGYESILEGEITQTGVGFVYKRKLRRIGDMFRFLRPKRRTQAPANVPEVLNAERTATFKNDDNETR